MRLAVALLVATLGAASVARAQSRYERVKITPIKNKAGAVTGARIKMALHKADAGHIRVNVGLLPGRAKAGQLTKYDAMDPTSRVWLLKLGEISDMKVGEWREVEFKVDYAKNKDRGILGGEKYQLTTSWPHEGWKPQTNMHVFGPMWTSWGEPEITLPK